LPEEIAWRAKAEMAALHKRARDYQQALPLWTELAAAPNGWRIAALEELAKYYEHRAHDYSRALELARAGLAAAAAPDAAPWHRRTRRLQSKLSRAPLFAAR